MLFRSMVDAFSSDAIPIHLITLEAVELMLRKLKPNGIIAYHISNRYVDLEPVLERTAGALWLAARVRDDTPIDPARKLLGHNVSTWVALARKDEAGAALGPILLDPRWRALVTHDPPVRAWTDDYSDVLALFKWR